MGKFDGYLICTDCDGTLTGADRKISQENQRAIRYFQENGGLFTIASGRFPRYIQGFSQVFTPNTYVVGVNGAVLYDLENENIVFNEPISHDIFGILRFIYEELPSVQNVVLSGGNHQIRYCERSEYQGGRNRTDEDLEIDTDVIGSVEDVKNICDAIQEDVYRILIIQDGEHTMENRRLLREKFGDEYNIVMSWAEGLEILDKKAGKGEMILRMKEILPGIKTTVGIGDCDNDISMLDMCDIGYAVDNAWDFVKDHADRITVSCNDSAISRVIQDIENGIMDKS